MLLPILASGWAVLVKKVAKDMLQTLKEKKLILYGERRRGRTVLVTIRFCSLAEGIRPGK